MLIMIKFGLYAFVVFFLLVYARLVYWLIVEAKEYKLATVLIVSLIVSAILCFESTL